MDRAELGFSARPGSMACSIARVGGLEAKRAKSFADIPLSRPQFLFENELQFKFYFVIVSRETHCLCTKIIEAPPFSKQWKSGERNDTDRHLSYAGWRL